jgi:hypothetical protein
VLQTARKEPLMIRQRCPIKLEDPAALGRKAVSISHVSPRPLVSKSGLGNNSNNISMSSMVSYSLRDSGISLRASIARLRARYTMYLPLCEYNSSWATSCLSCGERESQFSGFISFKPSSEGRFSTILIHRIHVCFQ